jgi:dephospho-CoA kinase
MHVLGIVGGVASGKSLVSRQLQALGAAMIDADKIGHEVLRAPEVEAAVRARWGSGVFDESGRVNRRAVAKIVFAPNSEGRAELVFLERLTHPRITARLQAELDSLLAKGDVKAVVLDAALLFRGGWDKLCDRVLFVDAPLEQRMARAQTRGWAAADVAAREASQEPLEEKRRRSHVVIDNAGTPEETLEQVRRVWETVVKPV